MERELEKQFAEGEERDLGFARVDLDRMRRRGLPETIFCMGKTPEQVAKIAEAQAAAGHNVLGTRADRTHYEAVKKLVPTAVYHELPRAITVDVSPLPEPTGSILIVAAGTSDLPVAEEAMITASRMGAKVELISDVGVAGIHRLLKQVDAMRQARVLIVVAGMEGALPSVVAGLVDGPVIALPTSVGYGLNLGGVTAMLAMMNSCAAGITVVNIDNGFGAGVAAAMINRL